MFENVSLLSKYTYKQVVMRYVVDPHCRIHVVCLIMSAVLVRAAGVIYINTDKNSTYNIEVSHYWFICIIIIIILLECS